MKKAYGLVRAVDVDFYLIAASCSRFGPNGAGDDDHMAARSLKPDAGEVARRPSAGKDDAAIRASIGVCFRITCRPAFDGRGEHARAGGFYKKRADCRGGLLGGARGGRRDFLKRPYGKLSGGQRAGDIARKRSIRRSLFDEPTTRPADEEGRWDSVDA